MANALNVQNNDLYVNGVLSAKTLTLPAGAVTDASVLANAGITASKLGHRNTYTLELFGPAVTITALTKWLAMIRGATGTIVSIAAAIAVVASDVSRTVSVDLQKSTGGGAFATVLTSPVAITSSTTVRTAVTALISSTGLVVGDILELVVTVAGGSGTQATGLIVTVVIDEAAS